MMAEPTQDERDLLTWDLEMVKRYGAGLIQAVDWLTRCEIGPPLDGPEKLEP